MKLAKREKDMVVRAVPAKGVKHPPLFVLVSLMLTFTIEVVFFMYAGIMLISSFIKHVPIEMDAIVTLGIALICWLYGCFVDIYYDFQMGLRYVKDGDKILVNYNLDTRMYPIGAGKVLTEVVAVTKYRVKRKKITVYGEVVNHPPMGKQKTSKKLDLNIRGIDKAGRDCLISWLDSMKGE